MQLRMVGVEGPWAIQAAIDTGVPVLATALFARFRSQREKRFADPVLSAMRRALGGHREKAAW